MSLLVDVRRTLRRHQLVSASTRVVVAFSGGPDSTALLHVLRDLRDAGELHLAGIAHLNHQLRADADADEHHCGQVAAAFGLAYVSERVDVRAAAGLERRSLEAAAHRLRHAFFERAVAALNADVMAVGHTKDDQAETFLLRLIRGAGTRGLSGMWPRHGLVVRPLIDSTRAQVRAFLDEHHVEVRHDVSNTDVSIPRNRVRAELLPLLTERFNPQIVDTLAADAALNRDDQAYFEPIVRAWMATHVRRPAPGRIAVSRDDLAMLPRAVARRVLHAVMRDASGNRPVLRAHVDAAWEAVVVGTTCLDAPRHHVQRLGADVVLTSRPDGATGRARLTDGRRRAAFSHPLQVPGTVEVPEIGCMVSAEVVTLPSDAPTPNRAVAVVPKDKVSDGLVVRSRRAGDRLRPSSVGRKKLQDLLVDRKVPREARDQLPIVTDRDGRIVWVAGLAIDRDFRVTDPAQAVVILRLKAVGGSS